MAKVNGLESLTELLLTSEQYEAIGRVAVEAAGLEDLIEVGVWAALGVPADRGRVVTRRQPVSTNLIQLRSLLLAYQADAGEEIKQVCQAATDALARRNTLLHGVIFSKLDDAPAFSDGTSFSDGTTWTDSANTVLSLHMRNRATDKELPVSEAAAVASDLIKARQALLQLVMRHDRNV